jgi:threonine dehydrogenase-like Zn-dependent dehydrogenase
MRALVYHGPGQKAWEEVPDPEITDEADAIIRVDATTICGTDLHILAGDVPEVRPGRILGHEAIGTVAEAGDGVRRLAPGDWVAVKLARPGGRIANVGVHGKPAMLHLEEQWIRDITITTGQLDAGRFVTHRFSLDEFEKAYEVFGDPAATGALKVVLTREEDEDK